jgi:serine/threonine protein kinase
MITNIKKELEESSTADLKELDARLLQAATDHKLEEVRHYLTKGANINARTIGGTTPLMLAASMGDQGLVFSLVTMGADTTLTNQYNETALQIAERDKRLDIAGLLRALEKHPEKHEDIAVLLRWLLISFPYEHASDVFNLVTEQDVWCLADFKNIKDETIYKSKNASQIAKDLLLQNLKKKGFVEDYLLDVVPSDNQIGFGRGGKVVQATYLGQTVALKQIECNRDKLESMWHEIGIHQSITKQHENVLRFLGYYLRNDMCFIVVPYLPLRDLEILLQEKGKLYNMAQKMLMAIQIVSGMDHLGRCNIIHRDLAPRNVLLSLDDNNNNKLILKIADFGLPTG